MNFSIKEASKLLGVKVRTVREWIRNGKIKAVKNMSGYWRISSDEIERVLDYGNKN